MQGWRGGPGPGRSLLLAACSSGGGSSSSASGSSRGSRAATSTESITENYRRFTTAAEAIRYAVEDLRTPKALGAWLQVADERFNSRIQRLYEAADYPLRKSE